MSTKSPPFDDMAQLMSGVIGVANSAKDELRTLKRAQAERFIADMDLAGRAEVEILKDIAQKAIMENETLLERVKKLEKAVAKLEKTIKNA